MSSPARLSLVGLISLVVFFAAVKTAAPLKPAADAPDGAAIYAAKCAGCHGVLNETDVAGASAQAVQRAIERVGQMKSLRGTTAAEVQAVAGALARKPLATTASAPASTTAPATEGASLYQARCASCHRPLERSDVRGASEASIREAVREKKQMRNLSTMTPAEMQAVADALARQHRPPTTPTSASVDRERQGKGHREHEEGNDD